MSVRTLRLLVVAILVLAFGALAAACDGDGGGSLTLDEYFEELAQLDKDKDDRNAEIGEQFDADIAAAASEEEGIEVTRDFFNDGVSNLKDFVDGLDGVSPPEEAAEAHNKAVDAGQKMIDAAEDALSALDEAETVGDLEAAFSGDFEVVAQDFEDACVGLQSIADDNNIAIDLDCED